MESIALNQPARTASTAIVATRPVLATDGVDCSAMSSAGIYPTRTLVFVQGDGATAAQTLAAPTGGTSGPEVWMYRADRAGVSQWWLVGFLNLKSTIPIPGGAAAPGKGGYCEALAVFPQMGTRLAIAGTLSAGAATYFVEPLEFTGQ